MNAVVESEAGTNGSVATKRAAKAKAEVETVTMEDGRKIDFTGKKLFLKEPLFGDDGTLLGLRMDFRNGVTRMYTPNPVLIPRYAGHGMSQKYGDNLAGETKPAEGQDAVDIDDLVIASDELHEQLTAGQWRAEREGGSGMGGTSVLIKALMEYGGQSLETVKNFLRDKDQKFKMGLRTNDTRKNKHGVTLASIVKRIEAEKLAKVPVVDTSDALDGLEGAAA